MKLTPGKLAGMNAVSNERGVIAAAAMDQRGSLQKSLAKEKGAAVSDAMMEEFKTLVSEVLTPHASAILLDPEWGLPASKRRAKNAGLLLAYEKTGYDKTGPGRLGDLLDHWSVRRLKEAGADCIKILLYYTPFDPKDINDQKHAWVERLGDECRANDIPFFLEFVVYEEGVDEKGFDFSKKKPKAVIESMREFTKAFGSYFLSMSLFGLKQAENMMRPRERGEAERPCDSSARRHYQRHAGSAWRWTQNSIRRYRLHPAPGTRLRL